MYRSGAQAGRRAAGWGAVAAGVRRGLSAPGRWGRLRHPWYRPLPRGSLCPAHGVTSQHESRSWRPFLKHNEQVPGAGTTTSSAPAAAPAFQGCKKSGSGGAGCTWQPCHPGGPGGWGAAGRAGQAEPGLWPQALRQSRVRVSARGRASLWHNEGRAPLAQPLVPDLPRQGLLGGHQAQFCSLLSSVPSGVS